MSELFKKLNLRPRLPVLLLNAPASFEPEVAALAGVTVLRSLEQGQDVRFALTFVITQEDLDAQAAALVAKAAGDALLWFAYPKQTSKRYRCEFNRDSGWGVLEAAGYQKVRMVAIDEDWSALRFRKLEFMK